MNFDAPELSAHSHAITRLFAARPRSPSHVLVDMNFRLQTLENRRCAPAAFITKNAFANQISQKSEY
jgi:hypothetical protein